MSEWAVLNEHTLVATWPAPDARRAELVAEDASADPGLLRWVALVLTDLSSTIWQIHRLPWVVPMGEPSRVELVEAIGTLLASELVTGCEASPQTSELLEAAADLGVELHEVCDELPTAVAAAVRREVHREIEAVRTAVEDSFDGRAMQALCAARSSASPAQVEKAADNLHRRRYDVLPFELATEVEPASAAVAAGEWFGAALRVLASSLGYLHLRTVLMQANDQVAQLPMAVLTSVADQLEAGVDPPTVVELLLNDAYLARSGWAMPHLPVAAGVPPRQRTWSGPGAAGSVDEKQVTRISTLDPNRAGPELVIALVHGVIACRKLYVANGLDFGRADDEALVDEFFERLREQLEEQ